MNKPTTDAKELLRRIDRFTADADYTVEELKEQLRNEGVDPDELLRKVKARIEPLYKFKDESSKT
jgi:hypothetical protein